MPEGDVVGIGGLQFVRVAAGGTALPIGDAGDDEPVNVSQAPVVRDEFAGEPVEQRGVGRRAGGFAEVRGGRHEARAEVSCPEVIHRHARGERILRVRQPARESQPASAALRGIGGDFAGLVFRSQRLRAGGFGFGEGGAGLFEFLRVRAGGDDLTGSRGSGFLALYGARNDNLSQFNTAFITSANVPCVFIRHIGLNANMRM